MSPDIRRGRHFDFLLIIKYFKNMTNGLGRGLNSLIPQKNQKDKDKTSAFSIQDKNKVLQIEVTEIITNSRQPRQRFTDYKMDELVSSIKEYGIIQPLIVSPKNKGYELIAGERRLRAARELGLKKVPVIIRDANEQEKLELALIENIQREDLNPVETAIAYKQLLDEFNLTQEELSKRIGKPRPSIANTLRILNLPEEIKLALIDGKISEGHAKLLVGLNNEAKQMSLFRKIVHSGLSVGDTLKETRRMGGTKMAKIKINYEDKDKEFALREFFGTKVEIKRKRKGGQIIIDFYSDDELNEIIAKVKKF